MTEILLQVPEDEMDKIRLLMSACRLESTKELLNNSLTLFEWVVMQIREGKIIGAINPERKTFIELKMPFMNEICP